jgi:hypothetical protein
MSPTFVVLLGVAVSVVDGRENANVSQVYFYSSAVMEACVHERHPRSAAELERAPSAAARGSEGRPIAIVDKARRVSLLGARSKPRAVGAGTAALVASDTAKVSPPASAHGTDSSSRAGTIVISFSIFDDTRRELVHCGDVAHRRSLLTAVEVQHAHSDNPNAGSALRRNDAARPSATCNALTVPILLLTLHAQGRSAPRGCCTPAAASRPVIGSSSHHCRLRTPTRLRRPTRSTTPTPLMRSVR